MNEDRNMKHAIFCSRCVFSRDILQGINKNEKETQEPDRIKEPDRIVLVTEYQRR